jgi:peptidylprolyl isomerase
VHCTGRLTTGRKFWSTKDPGQQPYTFQVGLGKVTPPVRPPRRQQPRVTPPPPSAQVIRGWDAAGLTMRRGEVALLECTADNAYGERGFPAWGIPPHAPLLFEIEVLDIT